MSVEIKVPALPESVADATLVAWRKQPGEAVARDENLADLETDKVVLEVPAPVAGVLREIPCAERHDGEERASCWRFSRSGANGGGKARGGPRPRPVRHPKLGPAARRCRRMRRH